MCSRYFVERPVEEALEDIVPGFDREILRFGDIRPSEEGCILHKAGDELAVSRMKWGFPGYQGNLVINARVETIEEKKMFRENVLNRRCLVPVSGFYEWDPSKEKVTFTREGVFYLAAVYALYEALHYTIITTAANASVAPVHDRMPFIIAWDDIPVWLGADFRKLWESDMPALTAHRDYEQLSLF